MPVRPHDLASTMLERHRRERAREQSRAAELRRLVEIEVRATVSEGLATRAWLIGSLAWGNFGPHSDVDIVVEGTPPERAGLLWDRFAVRLRAPVDLLRLEVLPERFRHRVLTEGVPLHVP